MRSGTGAAIAVLCGVQFIDVMGVTSAVTALPAMLDGLDAPAGAGPLVASAYATFFGGLLLLGAQLGDRYGHRRVLIAGTVGFALVGVLGATAAAVPQLVAARALQGAAAAVSVPSALTLLLGAAEESDRRQTALAAWSASGAAAGATGLLVGGLVTQQWGWPAVFWLNVPVGLALAVAVRALVPRAAPVAGNSGPNWLASGLVVVSVALLILGAALAETPAAWLAALALIVAGALVAAVVFAHERRSARPMFAPEVVRSSSLRTGSVIAFVNTATTSSASVLASLHLQQRLGLSPAIAGLALLPLSVGVIAGAAASKPLARRLDARRLAGLGLLAIAVGTGAFAAFPTLPGVVGGAAVIGLGLGCSSVAGNDLGTDVPPQVRGLATGVVNTAAQLGTALGVAALMVLAAVVGPDHGGTVVAWLTAAGIAVLTAAGVQRVRARTPAVPSAR